MSIKNNGVIFISINDKEQANLKLICNEIFGEENFIAEFPRTVGTVPKTTKLIQNRHDYILCYTKTPGNIFNTDKNISEKHFVYDDNDGRGKYSLIHPLDSGTIKYSSSLDYEIKFNNKIFLPGNHIKNKQKNTWLWRWSKNKVEWGIKNNLIVEKNGRLYTKNFKDFKISKNNSGYNLIKKENGKPFTTDTLMSEKFSNRIATREIKSLFTGNKYFDYPKPVNLIKKLIEMIKKEENDIILDFFAGSGTTGDAVMQLNTEDGGNRKFILVQLPEPIDPKKNKVAYEFVKNELDIENPTIFDITKERLIR